MDIVTDCWSKTHVKWILSLAMPMIILYVIGAPLLALIVLYKSRKNLDNPNVVKYILLLYQGLRHEEDENFLWYKSKSQSTNQEISSKERKSKFTTDNKQKEHTNMKMISKNESHATYGSFYRNDQIEESNISARTPKKLLVKGKNKTYGRIDSKNIGKFSVQTQFKRRKQKKKKQDNITDKILIEESKEDRNDLNIFKRSNNQTDYPKRKKNLMSDTKANKASIDLVQDLKDDINEEESKRELMKLDQDEVEHHYIFENFSLKRVE